jgi:hypothetical protein
MKRANTLLAVLAIVTLAGVGLAPVTNAQSVGYNFFSTGAEADPRPNGQKVRPNYGTGSRPSTLAPKLDQPTDRRTRRPQRAPNDLPLFILQNPDLRVPPAR